MKKYPFALGMILAALISLSGCSSPWSLRDDALDTSGWVTHCFGRFLIDLPAEAEVRADYYLWNAPIKRLDIPVEQLDDLIAEREKSLKTQSHKKSNSMFVDKAYTENGATILLSWKSNISTLMHLQDTYLVSKPEQRVYHHELDMSNDHEIRERVFAYADNLAMNIHSSPAGNIPTSPGFCIEGAYIEGDYVGGNEFRSEGVDVGITFPGYPGVFFEFSTSTSIEDEQLLDRAGGFFLSLLIKAAGINTLRKGQHNVGPIQAQEYLLATTDNGQRIYTFCWESQGKRRVLSSPHIHAELTVQQENTDDDGQLPIPAFRSDKEALQLWDAIIGTIRLRPGAVDASLD